LVGHFLFIVTFQVSFDRVCLGSYRKEACQSITSVFELPSHLPFWFCTRCATCLLGFTGGRGPDKSDTTLFQIAVEGGSKDASPESNRRRQEVAEEIPTQAGRTSRRSHRGSDKYPRHSFRSQVPSASSRFKKSLGKITLSASSCPIHSLDSTITIRQYVRQKHVVALAEHEGAPPGAITLPPQN
jgi:hypothetical protein